MAVCVKKKKKDGELDYRRVSKAEAAQLVENDGWEYAPKSEWQRWQRGVK